MSSFDLSDLLDLFQYQFFVRALVGGALAAVVSAWVGLFLILRKESMLVDGVAHTAFGGVALGLLIGIDPMIGALAVSIVAVFGITYMRRKGLAQSDSAIAVMMAMGFSLGMIIIYMAERVQHRSFQLSLRLHTHHRPERRDGARSPWP